MSAASMREIAERLGDEDRRALRGIVRNLQAQAFGALMIDERRLDVERLHRELVGLVDSIDGTLWGTR